MSLLLRPILDGLDATKTEMERSVEFKAKNMELQIHFEVQHGILKPCQNLHAKGGRLVDLGNELKVVGEIAMWGESRRRDNYVGRQARAASYEEAQAFGVQERSQYEP